MPKSEPDPKRLIYGEVDEYLVALPEARVRELSALLQSLLGSRTWGQLREAAPREEVEWILDHIGEDYPGDDVSFDFVSLSATFEGDYPPWPAKEMLVRLPRAIRDQFVTVEDTRLNGEFGTIELSREAEFVSALRASGYSCTRDDSVMRRISGYWDAPDSSARED